MNTEAGQAQSNLPHGNPAAKEPRRRFVVDDKIPYIRPYLEQAGDCVFLPGRAISADDVRQADTLVVRTRTKVDARLLEGSRVRQVVTATIGFDHLDTAWLEAQGIAWHNCPGCNAPSVAQYVREALHSCGFPEGGRGRTAGIVGLGHVGRAVRAALEKEGWQIRVSDPPLGLNDDLTSCDVITFHVPLTHDGNCPTCHMADAAFFRALCRRPLIVNAARGGVVDEEALLQALDTGAVSGAVIDCWEHEPDVNRQLLQRALLATPHIAGYSANGKAAATWQTLRHIDPCGPWPASPAELLIEALGGSLPSLPPYDPTRDSEALKAHPENFESLRGNYPLRLE